MSAVTDDPLFSVALVGGFIGMAVGLVTIWSQFRTARHEQKKEIEASNLASENRLKEFFDLKLRIVDGKIDNVKEKIEEQDKTISDRFDRDHNFFRDWIQRIEDEIDTRRHSKTRK